MSSSKRYDAKTIRERIDLLQVASVSLERWIA